MDERAGTDVPRALRSLDLRAEQQEALTEAVVAGVAVEVYRQLRALRPTGAEVAGCAIIGNCSGGPGCDIIGNCSSTSQLVELVQRAG